ncbi:MAG TPA: hypothetical protein PLJ27_22785, partial [Polyangiaceae bacterium]|nr:hypothetical protein [Polyangiaceae bacterium]HOR38318.1 hypothetical protein [Polyangiaceae bacterium]HOT12954.1 hypothetical protein [Polyangiaceae bacterium]HPB99334.1 hypothetical protein [Polyangiaceae bacterium]HQF26924.1 hypothetical protein [Polyangiaceae bacterium]
SQVLDDACDAVQAVYACLSKRSANRVLPTTRPHTHDTPTAKPSSTSASQSPIHEAVLPLPCHP